MPNRSSKPKRPAIQTSSPSIVDIATGEVEDEKSNAGKDPAAVDLGRRGGLKGGAARKKTDREAAISYC